MKLKRGVEKMADNKWIGVSATLNPPFLQEIKDLIDPIFAFLNVTLDLVNTVLQFVQAFLVGVGNPIKALLDQLIELIKGILRDLRNTGVYLTYDKIPAGQDLISDKTLKQLAGGYLSYENRTINKLLDKTDPTRPDFSKASSLLCVHFVGGGDLASIYSIYEAVQNLLKLLRGAPDSKALAPPKQVEVNYLAPLPFTGGFGSVFPLKKSDISGDSLPTYIQIGWSILPPAGGNGVFSGYVSPPPAFLVHVTTIPVGVLVGYEKVIQGSKTGTGFFKDTRNPKAKFRWYGSPYFIDGPEAGGDLNIFFKINPDDPEEQRLLSSEVTKFQHTYYFETNSLLSALSGNSYSLDIKIDQLPEEPTIKNGHITSTGRPSQSLVYITVQGIGSKIEGASHKSKISKEVLTANPQYVIPDATVPYTPQMSFDLKKTVGVTELTPVESVEVDFALKAKYVDALREALTWVMLSRFDLMKPITPPDDIVVAPPRKVVVNGNEIEVRSKLEIKVPGCSFLGVSLKESEFNKLKNILDIPVTPSGLDEFNSYFKKDYWTFASFVKDRVDRAVQKTTAYGYPSEAELFAYEEMITKFLTNSKKYLGGQLGLYASLSDNDFFTEKYQLYGTPDTSKAKIAISNITTNWVGLKSEQESSKIKEFIKTSLDEGFEVMPSYRSPDGYLRPLVWQYVYDKQDEIADPIEQIIRMSANPLKYKQRDPEVGQWIRFKFFRDGFPLFEDFLKQIIDFCQKLSDALNNIIQAIIDFIAQLQQRILELKRFIARIKAIIDAILSFKLPTDLSFLYTISNGTNGAVADLVGAKDKPQINGQYSFALGGSIVVGAPIPFITELLALMFKGD